MIVNLMKTSPLNKCSYTKFQICGPLQPNCGTKLKSHVNSSLAGSHLGSCLDECLNLVAGSEVVGELETLGYTFRESHCNPRARKNNGGNTSL